MLILHQNRANADKDLQNWAFSQHIDAKITILQNIKRGLLLKGLKRGFGFFTVDRRATECAAYTF